MGGQSDDLECDSYIEVTYDRVIRRWHADADLVAWSLAIDPKLMEVLMC